MIKKQYVKLLLSVLACLLLALPGYGGQTDEFEVYFEPFAITPNMESMKTLDQIRDHALAHPGQKLLIQGYTDPLEFRKGSPKNAKELDTLARSRADFVFNWLKTALGKDTVDATIRSYGGNHSFPDHEGKRVLLTFYDEKAPPQSLKSEESTGQKPHMVIPEATYHFSGIYEGGKVEHDFIVKNTGTDTLNILNVKPG